MVQHDRLLLHQKIYKLLNNFCFGSIAYIHAELLAIFHEMRKEWNKGHRRKWFDLNLIERVATIFHGCITIIHSI